MRILVSNVTIAVLAAIASVPAAAQSAAAPGFATARQPLNPQPLPPRWSGGSASPDHQGAAMPLARPDVAQKTGIIIVGGGPAAPVLKKLDPPRGR